MVDKVYAPVWFYLIGIVVSAWGQTISTIQVLNFQIDKSTAMFAAVVIVPIVSFLAAWVYDEWQIRRVMGK